MKFYSFGLYLVLATLFSCSSSEKKIQEGNKPVAVTVTQSAAGDTGVFVVGSGKLVAKNTAHVSTRMMGYITNMPVKVGQTVQAGQLLVNINSADVAAKSAQVSAQIAQAQANLNNAQKDYQRFKNLYESQSATAKELDDMRTRYEIAKAGVTAAQQMKNEVNTQFSYANITAPISGVVTQTFVKQGDMANPGMPLLTIEAPSQLQAEVLISENDITTIQKGMPANIQLKSTGQVAQGIVTEVSMSASNTGGQYVVKVNLDKPDENLLPGMFVQVQFPVAGQRQQEQHKTRTVMVPETALVHYGQLTGLYTVSNNNTALLRWVRTGNKVGNEVEILSGLGAGESYIVSAEGKLYNGINIQVK